jgi:hypothetical protein
MAATSYKRKGSNDAATRSVVVNTTTSTTTTSNGSSWQDTKAKLAALRHALQTEQSEPANTNKNNNNNARSAWSVGPTHCLDHAASIDEAASAMTMQAAALLGQLEEAIVAAEQHVQQQSQQMRKVQSALQLLAQQRTTCLQELTTTDQQIHVLNTEIVRYQQQADEQVEAVDQVQQERALSVPRLQHLISLYAMCSGIEWDFEQERVLAGCVVRIAVACLLSYRCMRNSLTLTLVSIHHHRPFLRRNACSPFSSTHKSCRALRLPMDCGT